MKINKFDSQIHTTFLDELGHLEKFPVNFLYKMHLFKNFQHENFGGEDFIVATNPYVKNKNVDDILKKVVETNHNPAHVEQLSTDYYCNNSNLLISLLKLNRKIRKYDYDSSNKECIREIIKWCNQYGLPFTGKQENIFTDINDKESFYLWHKCNKVGFSVSDFIKNTSHLSDMFLFYVSIRDEEVYEELKERGFSLSDCLAFLILNFSSLKMNVNFDFKTFTMNTRFDNAFQAAIYELIHSASKSRNQDVAICPECKTPFLRDRKNKKYCPNCYPQKAYKRKISKTKQMQKEAEK